MIRMSRFRPMRRARALASDPTARDRLRGVAAAVVLALAEHPGLTLRKLRAAVRGTLGRCSDGDTDAAVVLLGDAVLRTEGARGAHHHAIDVAKVPLDVRERLDARAMGA